LTLGYFPADTTPLQGIRKLLPGHLLIAERGRIEIEPFWELPYPSGEGYDCSDAELAERLLAELDEAVRLRLMSDVPLGAMLSGGLDSSVIVALMARHATGELRTFSVGFAGDTRSELPQAREVARRFGARHEEVVLGPDEQGVALDELAWHLDEPVADLSSLGFFALCQVATQHVTVALCGQGADELLGGYPSHRNAAAARFARGPLRGAASLASRIGPVRTRRAASVVGAPDAVSRFVRQASHIDDGRRAGLYRGPLADYRGRFVGRLCSALLNGHSGSPLQDTLYLSAKLALVDDMLLYFDRTSMACSLEVRPPFLDHRLVEWCARVPDRLKVDSRYRGKALLRAAAKDLIPPRIVERPKVGFFSGAVSSWFRGQANGVLADWLLQPNAACAEFLDRTEVERLVLGANGANSRDESNLLLAILMLEVWLSSVLHRASTEAAPAAPGGAAA
jgi:asparagine synthase (glutamine-hydrolysing)